MQELRKTTQPKTGKGSGRETGGIGETFRIGRERFIREVKAVRKFTVKDYSSKEADCIPLSNRDKYRNSRSMDNVIPRDLYEAEELLKEVQSWSEEEIEELPKFYREKAKEYQGLLQEGEE